MSPQQARVIMITDHLDRRVTVAWALEGHTLWYVVSWPDGTTRRYLKRWQALAAAYGWTEPDVRSDVRSSGG